MLLTSRAFNTIGSTPPFGTQTSDMILKAKKAFLSYWRFSFCTWGKSI